VCAGTVYVGSEGEATGPAVSARAAAAGGSKRVTRLHAHIHFCSNSRPGKYREAGDPKEWSAVLVTALGSWGKPVPRGLVGI
jgi:hypothetical protein